MKKIQKRLTSILVVFSIVVVFLFIEILIHPTFYQFLIPLVLLSVVIYWQLIKYLSILIAVPIYQNDEVLVRKFETVIGALEPSKKVTIFLYLAIDNNVIGFLLNFPGFIKLINNSTGKEYSLKLYTLTSGTNKFKTLTKVYIIQDYSFSNVDSGDYTVSIDTGNDGIKIQSLKVIEK